MYNPGITVDTWEKLCKILEYTPNDVLKFVELRDKFLRFRIVDTL